MQYKQSVEVSDRLKGFRKLSNAALRRLTSASLTRMSALDNYNF